MTLSDFSLGVCPSIVLGNPDSEKILVFIAGFPDDEQSGWGPVLPILEKQNNCRMICMCMPGFSNNSPLLKPWGYSMPEILCMINNTINFYVPDEKKKVNLIIHDWGAIYGYIYQNHFPDRVDKIVSLDVGLIGGISSLPLRYIPVLLIYQIWFAVAYIISQTLSVGLGQIVFRLFHFVPGFLRPSSEATPRPRHELHVHMGYLYYHFWRAFIFNRSRLLTGRFPTCPLLFIVRKSTFSDLYSYIIF